MSKLGQETGCSLDWEICHLGATCTQIVLLVQETFVWCVSLRFFLCMVVSHASWGDAWLMICYHWCDARVMVLMTVKHRLQTDIIWACPHVLNIVNYHAYASTCRHDLLGWLIRYHLLFLMNAWGPLRPWLLALWSGCTSDTKALDHDYAYDGSMCFWCTMMFELM